MWFIMSISISAGHVDNGCYSSYSLLSVVIMLPVDFLPLIPASHLQLLRDTKTKAGSVLIQSLTCYIASGLTHICTLTLLK